MAFWQIDSKEYLSRLGLNIEDFERELRLPRTGELRKIVPLKEVAHVQSMVPINYDLLLYLIRRVRTLDGKLPFQNSTIKQVVANPCQFKIGQKFVYKENYHNLVENVFDIFRNFTGEWSGLSNLGAYFIFGLDTQGNYAMACYIPPIIEIHESRPLIMDGIHRNYISRQVGMTINALLVKNVEIPFPCSPRSWKEIKLISLADKPKELEDRYFDLQKNLFRDLKYLGIDG